MAGAFSSAFSTAFDVGGGGGPTFKSAFVWGSNPRVLIMQKNVAGQKIGAQLVSATDGSAFTGSVTVAVTGDAGTQATGSVGSGACTHEGGGYHTYAPAQAETNYDLIAFTFSGTGAVPVTVQVYTRFDANVTHLLGTAWLTPGTAGTPDVNVKLWNALATVALPLTPTTAGRTLDVSAGGEAGVDWANVGSPTTPLNLSGTTIATTQKVDVDTIKTNPVVNGGTITFPTGATLASTTNITAGTITTATNVTTVNGLAPNVITATAIASDAITDAKVASDVTIASVTGAVGSVTGNVGGNVTGSVGSVASGGISSASFAAGAINNAAMSIDGSELTAIPWNAAWDAEVQSEVQDALVANNLDHLVLSAVDTDFATTVHLNSVVGMLTDNGTSATFDRTTDSLEAIRDRGDAAWTGGGGGSSDWTADERTAIRSILGVPASGTTPDDPTTGILDTIRDSVATRATQTSVDDLPTNAELATALGTADDAVLAQVALVKAKTDLIPSDPADASDIAASFASLASSIDALPTNAELATALAGADDAVLAAIAALNNLSAAQVNVEVLDALATDTYAEPTGTPGATITLATKIGWLYMALRNGLTVTATKKQFLDDSGAAEWEKDLSDDGTTYTESEANAP